MVKNEHDWRTIVRRYTEKEGEGGEMIIRLLLIWVPTLFYRMMENDIVAGTVSPYEGRLSRIPNRLVYTDILTL